MSEYPGLRRLAGHVAMMDRGDPYFVLPGGVGRRIARALLAALDLAAFAPNRDGYAFRQRLDALERETQEES